MNVAYFKPLSRAWARMTKALFKPFDISRWFTVGFTAFLAGLLDGHSGGGGSQIHKDAYHDWDALFEFPYTAWDWLSDHPGWFMLIIIGMMFLILFFVLLTWLSSRGKFMFLDNVVSERARVIQPWYQFKMPGDSLFLWRVGFGFISLGVFILFFIQCFNLLSQMHERGFYPNDILTIIIMALLGLSLIIIFSYISLFLNDFIVPIMYSKTLSASQAWHFFLPLFTQHWLYFILYGLLIFFLYILVVIGVIVAGLFTCCIGFILLVIPYIGSVVTLPISYTYRAFSVEFLEQFGADYAVFPKSGAPSVS